jgi:hypothetical protein
MYTSINVLEVAGFCPPVPIFLPLVGGTVFLGDFIIRITVSVDERLPYFQFKVGQLVDKMEETDIAVNYFATEEQCIRAHLPQMPELLIPFTSLKIDIYEKCKTHEFVSLAYIDHIENKADMLVDPEGILNTFIVASQYIVGKLVCCTIPSPPALLIIFPSVQAPVSLSLFNATQDVRGVSGYQLPSIRVAKSLDIPARMSVIIRLTR